VNVGAIASYLRWWWHCRVVSGGAIAGRTGWVAARARTHTKSSYTMGEKREKCGGFLALNVYDDWVFDWVLFFDLLGCLTQVKKRFLC